MKIYVLGLNHKTAPIAIREKLAFNQDQSTRVLVELRERYPDGEFVLLSTCNRTELYQAGPRKNDPGPETLAQFLADHCAVELKDFKEFLYVYRDDEAVRHLLEVSASLDSLVIGEAQISAQVKDSYRLAVAARTSGKVLNRLFHCAFASSKEVYTMTSITQRRVSVAGVAIELAQQIFESISSARVAVVGAGETAELLIQHLSDIGCHTITVYNRTLKRAEHMARRYNISAADWDQLQEALREVDIVVAAANAHDHLFDKTFLKGRRRGSLLIIDIAVPRNFDPAVNDLEGIYLYNIDDLAHVIRENIKARQDDIGLAQEIIADNVASFMDWFGVMDIGPLVGKLRDKFHDLSQRELQKFLSGEVEIPPLQKQKMQAAMNRIVDKLLHRLINNFHTLAKTHGPDEVTRIIESIIHHQDRT
ncbi:MAG: glutamyl-tRNA reductase [Sedimentisphaerales bacterium]|nr:glutamyl-tRNA reductase [Sedimentisphaerales bacterium]